MVDHIVDATAPRGRVEIRSGVGRRRRWSDEDKGRIVAESYAPGAVVSEIARRHEISPQHLFAWRKAARNGQLALAADEAAVFVPVMMAPQKAEVAKRSALPSVRTGHDGTAEGGGGEAIGHDRDGWGRGAGRMRRGCGVARGCAAGDEGSRMIVPSGAVRVLVATRPVDFRKGMDGLAALVRETLGSDPYSGVIYVFRAKRADRVKLLLWDGTGLVLVAKRLEKNSFRWPQISDGVMRLTSSQLSALLEGLDWTRVRAVRVHAPQATL